MRRKGQVLLGFRRIDRPTVHTGIVKADYLAESLLKWMLNLFNLAAHTQIISGGGCFLG